MKLQTAAILAVAAGAFLLLYRYQIRTEKDLISASQYGASWEPLQQDYPRLTGSKTLYV